MYTWTCVFPSNRARIQKSAERFFFTIRLSKSDNFVVEESLFLKGVGVWKWLFHHTLGDYLMI